MSKAESFVLVVTLLLALFSYSKIKKLENRIDELVKKVFVLED